MYIVNTFRIASVNKKSRYYTQISSSPVYLDQMNDNSQELAHLGHVTAKKV